MKIKIMRLQSIKTKVTLTTLLIFIISIWTLVFYATLILHDHIEQLVGEQQRSTADFMAAEISEQLKVRLDSLEKIASEIKPAMLDNPASLQAFLEQRPLAQILFNRGIFATGTNGTVIADVPLSAGRTGINYMDRTSIAVPLKEGKPIIGRPALGKALMAPLFSISVPIHGMGGEVIGALAGTITLKNPSFLDKISNNRYGKTGGYLLIDRQNRLIITATNKNRILTPLPKPGINPLLDRYMQNYEGFGTPWILWVPGCWPLRDVSLSQIGLFLSRFLPKKPMLLSARCSNACSGQGSC